MLHRLCAAENIKLVNIVRSDDQEALLRGMGAATSATRDRPTLSRNSPMRFTATGATIAFDAVGGGPLAGQILRAMEVAASKNIKTYSRYGSTVHKQVYLYGGLDPGPLSWYATTAWPGE
jgi:NADPH2:quinone reductase